MTPVAIFWLVYLLPILPVAMLLLWFARNHVEDIPERHQGPMVLVLAPFWPALALLFVGTCLYAITGFAWSLATDPRTWWGMAIALTRPVYSLHCWCRARWLIAHLRQTITEQGSVPQETTE